MIHLTKIIAGILVLLALAFGGYAWMLSRQPAPQPVVAANPAAPVASSSKLFPVVVTTKLVPAGQVLPADALRVAQLPLQPGGAFADTAAVAGRVPVTDLAEGTPLQENQLVSGLALRLAEGERALAVRADEVMGVGNRVQPGDFVDVFVMFKSDNQDIDRSQARLLMPRMRVLAFGSASVDGGPPRKGDSNTSAPAPREPARTAVLAVPVGEVNRLTLGESSGRLLLALRHPADLSQPDPKLFAELPPALQPAGFKPGTVLQGMDKAQGGLAVTDLVRGGATAPAGLRRTADARTARPQARSAPAATKGLDVEIIRGDRRETQQY